MTDEEIDAKHARAMDLAKRLAVVMGWPVETCRKWAGIRKVAMDEAVVIGLDKLEEVLARLESK